METSNLIRQSKRIRAGIIPYATNNQGTTTFLFGKEIYGKWGPIAGTVKDEDLPKAGSREFVEETMGLFTETEILSRIDVKRKITCFGRGVISHYYLIPLQWDPHLPTYFRNVFTFFLRCTNGKRNQWNVPIINSCQEGLFEKSHLSWFTLEELTILSSDGSRSNLNINGIQATKELNNLDWNIYD